MVQPGMTLDLALRYANGSGQLHFEYSRAGAAVSLGRVHFGTADE
jgi:hypothetical protein